MSKQVIVDTLLGKLAGAEYTTVRGKVIYSFQGIPYAEPPVGDLRFKSPVPKQKWEGVKEALTAGNNSLCPVFPGLPFTPPPSSEDCLYLNVTTPQEPRPGLKIPVYVWIHGGGFTFGDGSVNSTGPDYLVPYGIILVSINYRLGALGFLSLETPECPGNYGLKDQTLALRWVKENIAAFGGDPDNITIGGLSAGGASVHYLLLSPSSKGLFHRAIANSGAATNPWAVSKFPRKSAVALAKKLGCQSKDLTEVLKFLRAADAKDIVANSDDIFRKVEKIGLAEDTILQFPFVPCVEPEGTADPFITRHPKDIVASGDFTDVPYVNGICEREGVFLLPKVDYVPTLDNDFLSALLPKELNLTLDSPKALEASHKIRDFYFPDGATHDGYLRLTSAVMFGYGIGKASEAIAKKGAAPVYLYLFKGSKSDSMIKLFFKMDHPATSHGEDHDFMFHRTFPPQVPIVERSEEDAICRNYCTLLTDFIKTGKFSTPWPEATEKHSQYLEISKTIVTKNNFLDGEIELWDEVYEMLTN